MTAQNRIDALIQDAIQSVLDGVDALVHNGDVTPEEADQALAAHSEFNETWRAQNQNLRDHYGLTLDAPNGALTPAPVV